MPKAREHHERYAPWTTDQVRDELARRTTSKGCPHRHAENEISHKDCPFRLDPSEGASDCGLVFLRNNAPPFSIMKKNRRGYRPHYGHYVDQQALTAMRIYWEENEL